MERQIPLSRCHVFVVGSLREYREYREKVARAGRDPRQVRTPVCASMRDLFPRSQPVPSIRQFVMGM